MPSEAEIGCYHIAPNRIGNEESEILGIARGIDNPGSVLVFWRHFLSELGAEPNPTEHPSTTHSCTHTISTIIPLTVVLFVRQHHVCIIQFIASTYIH